MWTKYLSLQHIIIKGSLSSSWMNSPIPSLLLPLWQNESLCETIGMKICVTCTVIHMKIKWFSCETFCTSTRSANSNSDGGSKVCICAMQSIRPALIRVSVAPPGRDASPSQGYLPNIKFASTYLYT